MPASCAHTPLGKARGLDAVPEWHGYLRPEPGGNGITPAQSRAIARWFNSRSFAALPLAEQSAIRRRVTLTKDPWGAMTEAERTEALTAR